MNPLSAIFYRIYKFTCKHYEKVCCCFLMLFIPKYFLFEMMTVRPDLVEFYKIGPFKHFTHIFLSTLCFINVAGNMVLSVVADPTLRKSRDHGEYCDICRLLRPVGSWHCIKCNACIIRRDHHCIFLSKCIGYNNQRYYVLFLFHVVVSMIYSTYYNYYYVSSKFGDFGVFISALRVMNPYLRYMIPEPMGFRDIFTMCFLLNVALLIWSSFLFVYHIKNVLRGVTSYQGTRGYSNLENWKENFVKVFGERWYLAMLFPFVSSALPGHVKIK